MKQYKLLDVEYQNIMSVGPESIKIDLGSHHKTLITGFNGAGKSTMLEAITFALFGKPFRDIKKGQLINSVSKKNLLVTLNFIYGNSTWCVKRGQKPNIFEVYQNGIKLDEASSSRDFQSQFEEMIGMNYASFKQVVVLGTAGYTPFMGLSTPLRRKLVEDLLEVTILADMDKANKDLIKSLTADINSTDVEIGHLTNQIQTHIDYAEKQKKMSGDNLDRFQKMYDDCISDVEAAKANIFAENQKLLENVLPENPNIEFNQLNTEYLGLTHKMQPIKSVLGLYVKGGNCPTCLQKLESPETVTDLKARYQELSDECDAVTEQKQNLQSKIDEYTQINATISSIETNIRMEKQRAVESINKAKKIKVLLDEAKKDVVDNSDQINQLNETKQSLVDKKAQLVQEKHNRLALTEMLKDSGIKSAIVKKYIPLFNNKINSYLTMLEADYEFELDDEFSEKITSRGRDGFSYASFSQGEKGRIDLAIMFTWRDIAELVSGIQIKCLFLDEVYDSAMDVHGGKNISTILNKQPDTNIFIISHREHNPQDYGQHLIMKKVGRFTVME